MNIRLKFLNDNLFLLKLNGFKLLDSGDSGSLSINVTSQMESLRASLISRI